jgi:RsiW-degrading membrane proteinase PrsW (M82 family)
MRSCPRCGATVGPDAQICPWCSAALPAAPASSANPTSDAAPPRSSETPSPNGLTPAQPSAETWGPGAWGPVGEIVDPYPPEPFSLPTASFSPPSEQPTAVREYATGMLGPDAPYRPPVRPMGARYPGYPIIPQHGQPAPASPYPAYPAYPAYPGYAYGWYPPQPPKVPGETYHKVLSILTLIACCLGLLGGLGILIVLAVLSLVNEGQDLSVVALLVMSALASLAGGGFGLYHSIRALMRRESAPFSLPHFQTLAASSLVVIIAAVGLFASGLPTGDIALILPLVLLSGILPAFTFLSLAQHLLRANVSWRRMALSFTSGATLSIGAALLLELLFTLLLATTFNLNNLDPTTFNPGDNPSGIIGFLALLALGAPIIEETTKQFGGFFLLPRIKRAQEAFLIGMASGLGFAIIETSGYIGEGQADWVGIAIQRLGAGLLHGMGAAMAGLGWYYLFKGKGMRRRWLLGIGCLVYAYVQHAIFNGGAVLVLVLIPPLRNWHTTLFGLLFDGSVIYAFVLYALILTVLVVVTRRLYHAVPMPPLAGNGVQAAPKVSLATASIGSRRKEAQQSPAAPVEASAPLRPPEEAGSVSQNGYIPNADALPKSTASNTESGGQA